MCRRTVAVCAVLELLLLYPGGANAQVLLGFIDSESRFAVAGTVGGAAARLARRSCQQVLADFSDRSGRKLSDKLLDSGRGPADAFAALRFLDNSTAPQCRADTTLVFTYPGSSVIHVCARQFVQRSMRNRMTAEIILIHEFLHALGLGENPPHERRDHGTGCRQMRRMKGV